MRISCDWDTKNPLFILFYIAKGTILLRKLPYKIRKTKRGVHCLWRGLNISEEKSYIYRKMLRDDETRIALDRCSPKRQKQILFSDKKVYQYEYDSFGNFVKKVRVQ